MDSALRQGKHRTRSVSKRVLVYQKKVDIFGMENLKAKKEAEVLEDICCVFLSAKKDILELSFGVRT